METIINIAALTLAIGLLGLASMIGYAMFDMLRQRDFGSFLMVFSGLCIFFSASAILFVKLMNV